AVAEIYGGDRQDAQSQLAPAPPALARRERLRRAAGRRQRRALGLGHLRMAARIVAEEPAPQRDPGEADDADDDEGAAPRDERDQVDDDERRRGVAEAGEAVSDALRIAPIALRDPARHGTCRRREGGAFADAEQQSHGA